MALSEEMSRGGGSTGTKGSSSPVAKELDAVIVNPPLRPMESEKFTMDSSSGPNRVSKEVNPMIRVSSPTSEPGLRCATGVSGSATISLKGSCDYLSMDKISTKGVSTSRISQFGGEDLEGPPMDYAVCKVAQGAISWDKRGVSPLSSGGRVAINAMVGPSDKTIRGEKSITSLAKGASNAPLMVTESEEESDDNREVDKEDLIYRQALIDKAMVHQ
ncbi:hypothetical protein U1Q18_015625 [Sarracenia purpurea var. burkii]